jgi:hypothetical protein
MQTLQLSRQNGLNALYWRATSVMPHLSLQQQLHQPAEAWLELSASPRSPRSAVESSFFMACSSSFEDRGVLFLPSS